MPDLAFSPEKYASRLAKARKPRWPRVGWARSLSLTRQTWHG